MPINTFGSLAFEIFASIKGTGGTVNIVDLMERFALDALGKTGFGFDFGALKDKNSPWVHVYNSIQHGMFEQPFFNFPILDQQLRWLFPKRKIIHDNVERFNKMLDNIIDDKRRVLQSREATSVEDHEKDLLTLMLEKEMDEKEIFSKEELRSNLKMFFMAGHGTTSNALSFALYHLAVNPEVQQKAREESISILGDGADVLPTINQIQEMTYINMIIKETLRIHCPLSSMIPRVANMDTVLADTLIPKGSPVIINMYDIHHNDRLWENPEKFDPDRFLPGGEADQRDLGPTWIPFGLGGRQCLGMNFTLAQQRVILSLLCKI
ncbi:cytochrome P450-dit2 [Apophysomyces sp. BC1034]|nr:cytochrome P450-dit2 [Apophysomyces sp. BC1021]KAG0192290.1 cytochrome P450-dit2 [Apophysomyces sp. BC1034]